ncbi:MAG: MarR family transcriptional regulator [Lachnospiraceae bacterium]|nr:MarR family transcriptional regulator [Lachnospiraceae bacterium]
MEKLYSRILEDEDLSVIQLRLLLTVRACGEIPVGQLGQKIGMNSGNCSSMCKKMEQKNLLARRRRREDERIVCLALTPEGQIVADRILTRLKDLHDYVCGSLSEEEMNHIAQSMDIVTSYVNRLV